MAAALLIVLMVFLVGSIFPMLSLAYRSKELRMKASSLLVIALLALAGCTGETGPQGPAGADFPGPPPAEYISADGIAGGAAYSKWWTAEAAGGGTQPATSAAADFYRCKACHAWDGMGNAASYADRTGQSTLTASRPDVASVNLRSTASKEGYHELFDLIRHMGSRQLDASDNRHPDFAPHLLDAQVWNLVKFMREEWVAPNLLYDIVVSGPVMYVDYSQNPPVVIKPTVTFSNIGALGNEADGAALFAARCAGCHGGNGTALDIEGQSLGEFLRNKPHELWFKAKFGEPGTGMTPGIVTATSDLQDLYRALANPAVFPDL